MHANEAVTVRRAGPSCSIGTEMRKKYWRRLFIGLVAAVIGAAWYFAYILDITHRKDCPPGAKLVFVPD